MGHCDGQSTHQGRQGIWETFGRVALKSESLFDTILLGTDKSHQDSKYLFLLLGIHCLRSRFPELRIYAGAGWW